MLRKSYLGHKSLPQKFTLVTEVEVEVLAGGGLEINRVGVPSNLLAGMNKGKLKWFGWGWEVKL